MVRERRKLALGSWRACAGGRRNGRRCRRRYRLHRDTPDRLRTGRCGWRRCRWRDGRRRRRCLDAPQLAVRQLARVGSGRSAIACGPPLSQPDPKARVTIRVTVVEGTKRQNLTPGSLAGLAGGDHAALRQTVLLTVEAQFQRGPGAGSLHHAVQAYAARPFSVARDWERSPQTLNRKFITSPSLTTYSLPSARSLPASRAPASPFSRT